MKIYCRNEMIWSRIVPAATFLTRMKGLLGRKSLHPDEGLLISPCRQVHGFHMRFPLDILFLDRQFNVLKVFFLSPGKISPTVKNAYYVLEVSAGQAEAFSISEGDQLSIKCE